MCDPFCKAQQFPTEAAISLYSSVQINEVKGCVSAVLVPATFRHVYLDIRVKEVESRKPDRRLPDGHLHADVAGQQGVAGHLRIQQRAAQ